MDDDILSSVLGILAQSEGGVRQVIQRRLVPREHGLCICYQRSHRRGIIGGSFDFCYVKESAVPIFYGCCSTVC